MSDGDGNGRGEGFLGRWSRLKRQGGPEPAPAADVPPAPAGAPQEQETAPPEALPLPELPSIESITAQTDISAFMHPAVPDDLRAAALRRLWSVDPSIRDFVSPAVDYAYDWNTPGGAPGWGALGRADDVARMLAEAVEGFARPGPAEPEKETTAAQAPDAPTPGCGDLPQPEPVHDGPPPLPEAVAPQATGSSETAPSGPAALRAAVLAVRDPDKPPVPARRHGGALPQ